MLEWWLKEDTRICFGYLYVKDYRWGKKEGISNKYRIDLKINNLMH